MSGKDIVGATRREYLAGSALAFTTPLTGLSIGSTPMTPLADAFVSAQGSLSIADFTAEPARYSNNPAWPVSTAEGELDALLDWAGSSDSRRVLHSHESTDTATITAPPGEVTGQTLREGLVDTSYVRRVDLAVRVSNIEPVSLNQTADAHPEFGTLQRLMMDAEPAPTDGVAFNAETTQLDTARETIQDSNVLETGRSSTLGVIDTGLNYDSDYFDDRLLDASVNFVDADNPTVGANTPDAIADGDGHGTWVTAAAVGNPPDSTYSGVAPGANILSIKALGDDGSGSTATIAQSVRYAADHGADSLCMSLGSPIYSQDLADAIDYATEQGTLIVVAAGNDRARTRFVNYPAADHNTLAVSATTIGSPSSVASAHFANVAPSPGTTNFSQGVTAGAEVGIAAPGMALEASLPGGKKTLSGTSMAAPFVAGAAPVVLEADASLGDDAQELRQRLVETAAPAKNLAAAESEHGLLDVAAAVEDTRPEKDQADVMTDTAAARDAGYRAESAARGGLLARYLF